MNHDKQAIWEKYASAWKAGTGMLILGGAKVIKPAQRR